MPVFWRALVVLLLALPVGAYVTGSLAGTQADLPDRLTPVVVEDPQPSASPSTDPSTGKTPRTTPGDDDRRGEDRGGDDGRGDDGRGDDGDDDEVQVIRPEPDDVGDDDRDDGRDDDTDDDTDGD